MHIPKEVQKPVDNLISFKNFKFAVINKKIQTLIFSSILLSTIIVSASQYVYADTGDYIDSFGSLGTADNRFHDPYDVEVDSNDRIIVADLGNNRIQVFNSAGIHQFSFDGPATNPSFSPQGITVDSNDRIIVADGAHDNIVVFDSDGIHQFSFGSFGTTNGKFDNPAGVAVDSNDRIIVADSRNTRIQVFDSTGAFQFTFGLPGNSDGYFLSPLDVTVDSNDRMIVVDSQTEVVQIFDSSGNHQITFGVPAGIPGNDDGNLNVPSGITVDANDNIIVSDTGFNRVQIFDSSGNHQFTFGSLCDLSSGTGCANPQGHGQFFIPIGITADSQNRIIVTEVGNDRIQILEGFTATDTESPVISLNGDSQITLEIGTDTYTELGAIVTDNDPNYSETVTIAGDTVDANTIGTYIITYDAPTDAAGNIPAQVTRTVTVEDTTSPVISLNGDSTITLFENETYTELGATVTDNSGEDLSGVLVIDSSNVDTSTAGTYQVTYDVSDSSGNMAVQITRTVIVQVPEPIILTSSQDSFLRAGSSNTNEGENPNMIVRASGNNRALVSFDVSDISNTIDSATLKLFVVHNSDNWSNNGRTIDTHMINEDWEEGDGANAKPKNLSNSEFNPFKNRGDGPGVTWKCAIDSEIHNTKADCATKWNGGTFSATPTDTVLITNGLTEQFIEFDLTADVNSCISSGDDSCSWIIKKTAEGQNGRVEFASKEGSASLYDAEFGESTVPQLVIMP